MFHLMAVHGADSRERRPTRPTARASSAAGSSVAAPQAMLDPAPLSGSAGLGARSDRRASGSGITLEPEQSATIDMVTGVGETRERRAGAGREVPGPRIWPTACSIWRGPTARWSLRQINATEADAQLYGRLAGSVLYANAALRAEAGVLRSNRRGQSGLWGYAISGDLPIVLLQISDADEHRSGAPAGAGACLLAPEGSGGRPGDLERGPSAATGSCCRTRSWD